MTPLQQIARQAAEAEALRYSTDPILFGEVERRIADTVLLAVLKQIAENYVVADPPVFQKWLQREIDAILSVPRVEDQSRSDQPQLRAGEADQRGDDRDSPPQSAIDIAIQMSTCSPCQSKRGATIFAWQGGVVHILGRGYNHKTKFECDSSIACKATCSLDAIHAEQMALINAAKTGFIVGMEALHVKTINGALVASGGPSCVECSKLLRASGIAFMWLYHAEGWRCYEIGEFHALSVKAELAAMSSVPPSSGEARREKNDHGAGLIHQTIPDVAETEPRPSFCPTCGTALGEDQ